MFFQSETKNREQRTTNRFAYFISPHGFGHAARSAAIMHAMHTLEANIRFELFTKVPQWFFAESTSAALSYHEVRTDIGLVQKTALQEDLAATANELDRYLPFGPNFVSLLADQVVQAKCRVVMCDISPLGIAVAKKAKLPSVLLENFTWDWIYEGYVHEEPRIRPHAEYFKSLFSIADRHIQMQPACSSLPAHLVTGPVCRSPRKNSQEIRKALEIEPNQKAVLVTTGGIPSQYNFLNELTMQRNAIFVMPGGSETPRFEGNLRLLPHRSQFYHPDLVWASDAVVGKLGYSTVSEVVSAGKPFAHVSRAGFRESPVLADFVHQRLPDIAISQEDFESGAWMAKLPELLRLHPVEPMKTDAAMEVARFVFKCVP